MHSIGITFHHFFINSPNRSFYYLKPLSSTLNGPVVLAAMESNYRCKFLEHPWVTKATLSHRTDIWHLLSLGRGGYEHDTGDTGENGSVKRILEFWKNGSDSKTWVYLGAGSQGAEDG